MNPASRPLSVVVAGSTGALGRPVVRALVARGHRVTGLTRRGSLADIVAAAGASPAVADVYDDAAFPSAIAAAEPDVVVHLLTALPPRLDPRRMARDMEPTNRLRTEGTDRLVRAARAAGARRVVAASIAFAYAASDSGPVGEDHPFMEPGSPNLAAIPRSVQHMERAVLGAEGIRGVVLRFGFLYGPGTAYARPSGSATEDVLRRRLPVLGSGAGRFSFLHVEDAASATVRAVEGSETGTFNIVEDDAPPVSEWLPAWAASLGAGPPRRVPRWLGRLLAGPYAMHMMETLPGASNARARERFRWAPTRRWSDAPVLGE